MRRGRIAGVAVVAVLTATLLGGCWGNHTSNNSSKIEPTGTASIIEFPHGFRNVAYKCSGTTMVYSLSAAVDDRLPGGVAVVPNDPRCK